MNREIDAVSPPLYFQPTKQVVVSNLNEKSPMEATNVGAAYTFKFFNCVLAWLINFFSLSGAIFEQGTDEVQSAFKFAVLNHNSNATGRRFELQVFVDLISTADAYKLSKLSEYKTTIIQPHHRSSDV